MNFIKNSIMLLAPSIMFGTIKVYAKASYFVETNDTKPAVIGEIIYDIFNYIDAFIDWCSEKNMIPMILRLLVKELI